MQRVLTFNSHNIAFTHFELNVSFTGVVFHDISFIDANILRARAVKLDILDKP